MAITLTDNQFFTGLSNLALIMHLYATNTSRRENEFIETFATETIGNGDSKLFVFSDLPSVTDYAEQSSLLTVTKVPVSEEKISISEKKVIKSSYNSYILEMAFTSNSGMNEFIGYLLGQMESAKTDYLYNVILTDIKNLTIPVGAVVGVNMHDLSGVTDLTQKLAGQTLNQKEVSKELQLLIKDMGVYSTTYNTTGYKTAVSVEDLRMVFCEPYYTENILDVMATLLNSSVITDKFYKPDVVEIPLSKITSATIPETKIGWLMHKKAYQWFYKFSFMGSFFDESNLCINNFLHFWYGKGQLASLPIATLNAVIA